MKAVLLGFLTSGLAVTNCLLPSGGDPNNGGGTNQGVACTELFAYGITAHVTNAQTSEVIANATLTLQDGSYMETMQTFSSGDYIGAGERAGTYTLTAVANGFQTYTQSNIVVTADECHVIPVALNIQMVPSGTNNGVPCTMLFAYGITAYVTNAQTGATIANATLTLQDGSYTEIMESVPSGGYVGAGERAGTYSLTAVANGYQNYTQSNIVVTADQCHVKGIVVDVKMVPK